MPSVVCYVFSCLLCVFLTTLLLICNQINHSTWLTLCAEERASYLEIIWFCRCATSAIAHPTCICSRATTWTRTSRFHVSARWPSRWAQHREFMWVRWPAVSSSCWAVPRCWSPRSCARRCRSAFGASSSSPTAPSPTLSSPYATTTVLYSYNDN